MHLHKNSLQVFRVPIQHYGWLSFQSLLHERDDLYTEETWKPLYSSLGEHVILAVEEDNQSQGESEIVTDEDENRKITAAEVLKKLMKWKILLNRPFEHDLQRINED